MSQPIPNIREVKEGMKAVWSTGDFGVIAKILENTARNFVDCIEIKAGSRALDVACGNGNVALLAAGKGAEVTGIDIVPDLIRQAKERAVERGLDIKLEVGDAEALPYSDDTYNYVLSMFGAMFAPRPDVTASELFRVCKPGGTVAMANWTRDGFGDDFFAVVSKYAPPPSPGLSPPTDWGNEEIVKERFSGKTSGLRMQRTKTNLVYDMPPAGTADYYTRYFGPIKIVYDGLDNEEKESFRNDITGLFEKYNTSKDGKTSIVGEYLQVVAVKK